MNSRKLLYIVLSLLTIGLVFISVSSISEAEYTVGDKLYFIKKQAVWSAIGLFVFFIATKIKLSHVKKYASLFFILCSILLALVLIPQFSTETLGARRWLYLGPLGIQPSEILKLAAIIFFSKIFSETKSLNIKNLAIYLSLPLTLVILEPNLSTAVLIAAIVITLYYIAGGEIISLFTLCIIGAAISTGLIMSSPYRLARFDSSSYHSSQMTLALTSGGPIGKGFANSEQKYRFLPKISTDSIFAVIGEELGFIGSSLIILLYILFIATIINISQSTSDVFSTLFAAGVASWISYQSLINVSAVVSIIPLTGVPLPLISYGGSSLVTLMFALGLVYSISRENKKEDHHHRQPPHPGHRANQSTKKR
jgi:cell division protein FtsW